MTPLQSECLIAIRELTTPEGVSPSYEDLRVRLKLCSKSSVCRLVNALEERGLIRRLAHRSRAIEVIDKPSDRRANLVAAKAVLLAKRHCGYGRNGDLYTMNEDELQRLVIEAMQ